MVAADREPVAGDDPDIERRIGELYAGGDRRLAAVDCVIAVRLEIVGKAARTADTGDAHRAFRPRADLRQGALHRLEDRIVSAARAPAHLLIRGEIAG